MSGMSGIRCMVIISAGVTEWREAGACYTVVPQCEGEPDAQQIMSHPYGRVLRRIPFQFPARLDSMAAG